MRATETTSIDTTSVDKPAVAAANGDARVDPATDAPSTDDANRAFSTSILVSAVRCSLAYVVFPWLLPLFGLAGGVGPGIGLAVGLVAIGFNVASIRRFHRSDHRWKWPITALNCTVIVMLSILAVIDVSDLLG